MNGDGRDVAGRFAVGNPGGPGRPRRAVERDYLTVLSDSVTMADWQDVVRRAVADAKTGDARAREWLTRFVIGERPPRLLDVAASEASGLTPEAEIAAVLRQREASEEYNARLGQLFGRLGDQ